MRSSRVKLFITRTDKSSRRRRRRAVSSVPLARRPQLSHRLIKKTSDAQCVNSLGKSQKQPRCGIFMVGCFEVFNPGSKCVGMTAVQVIPGLPLWATLLVFPAKISPNPEVFLFCLCSFVCFSSFFRVKYDAGGSLSLMERPDYCVHLSTTPCLSTYYVQTALATLC